MFVTAAIIAMMVQTSPPALISYEEAVLCAGVTQAASELEGGESRYGRALYDAALYWSLTAMQAATASGRDPALAEDEQTRARVAAVRRLSARNADTLAVLQRCRARTPRLS